MSLYLCIAYSVSNLLLDESDNFAYMHTCILTIYFNHLNRLLLKITISLYTHTPMSIYTCTQHSIQTCRRVKFINATE